MQTYLVGGAVRDQLLDLPVTDHDWLVVNAKQSDMLKLGFIQVGKNFPVFLHPKTHEEYALARTEIKTGRGYQAFTFDTDEVSLIEDLKRRDLTINAMAIDENGQLHDPFNGQEDIKNKKLRHVSDAFCEDPLRVLRVARFAAKLHYLGFTIADETLKLMQAIIANNELEALSHERILQEFTRALNTANFEVFLSTLQQLSAFEYILKPLQTLATIRIKPLLDAIQLQCKNHDILFALLFVHLDNEQALIDVLNELKPPKSTQILSLRLYRHHWFFSTLQQHSEKDILKAFKAIDALRNKPAFNDFQSALRHLYQNSAHAISNICLSAKIQKALTEYDYGLALKNIRNKQTIAKTVMKLQLQLIEEMLAKFTEPK
ncbi:multifunctional CCA tRNA nucleotidyl transferase/2'3'-cyclic phosphodiesterase/2'nucleotidase/phosphatase [Cysteiniphilum litorale]|uniref:multifunctional CCA tRNA nucleotidyl transferase/2'3'-cyclic phosphodiesterase/2'nucleotidase/phosphatase n=1 Tax=Cysteiniphilum litorale TaxID=2056700 RepID=UPI003F8807F8